MIANKEFTLKIGSQIIEGTYGWKTEGPMQISAFVKNTILKFSTQIDDDKVGKITNAFQLPLAQFKVIFETKKDVLKGSFVSQSEVHNTFVEGDYLQLSLEFLPTVEYHIQLEREKPTVEDVTSLLMKQQTSTSVSGESIARIHEEIDIKLQQTIESLKKELETYKLANQSLEAKLAYYKDNANRIQKLETTIMSLTKPLQTFPKALGKWNSTTACAPNNYVAWNQVEIAPTAPYFNVAGNQLSITRTGLYQINVRVTFVVSSNGYAISLRKIATGVEVGKFFCNDNTGYYSTAELQEILQLNSGEALGVFLHFEFKQSS